MASDPPDEARFARTLESGMSPHFGLYSGYAPELRWEEVVCNVFGLMCTEYAEGKLPGSNPFYQEIEGCASLKKLADIIRQDVQVAYDLCCEKHPLPAAAQAMG